MTPIIIHTMDICDADTREWRRKIQRLLLQYVLQRFLYDILDSILTCPDTLFPFLPVVDIFSKNVPLVFDMVGECNCTPIINGEPSSVDIPSGEVVVRGRDDRFAIETVSVFTNHLRHSTSSL
jgi:hypothetical protein